MTWHMKLNVIHINKIRGPASLFLVLLVVAAGGWLEEDAWLGGSVATNTTVGWLAIGTSITAAVLLSTSSILSSGWV